MKMYKHDGDKYLLPLKINLACTKTMLIYNLIVFLFLTLTSGLLVYFSVKTGIEKGFSTSLFCIIALFSVTCILSVALIFPRHLLIDAEKIQVRCFIFKKGLYWVGAESLTTHISDVAFTTQLNCSKSINLHIHKANQTNHGQKVGIKKFEITFRNRKGRFGSLHFHIADDSNVSLEMLNRTIYDAYYKRQGIVKNK